MAGNSNLHDSIRNRQDEFYTQLSMIESELMHYRHHFKGKIVLCNCDDPYESNFFKFFAMNFNSLGLKKLITTCYATSPVIGEEMQYFVGTNGQLSFIEQPGSVAVQKESKKKRPYKVEITEVTDENADGRIDLADVEYFMRNRQNTMTLLDGDGDFRSPECVDLLEQADIVVTNPPFSLFRDYVALLIKHEKQFLIIGNQNAVAYKELFPLIIDEKMWLGYNSGHFWFKVPDSYEEKATDFKIDENGQKWRRMGNICWYTNLDIQKRHDEMLLYRYYSEDKYPKYDEYDAIDVNKTVDIPCDYYGVMGVPITYMSQYNPNQFELLGTTRYHDGQNFSDDINYINGKQKFTRMLIRRKRTD